MSEVTLTIGGRSYTVSCAEGEEAHVGQLGDVIDGKLAQLGAGIGPNEARNFLFASLLLADDLHERVKELGEARQAETSAREELSGLSARLADLEESERQAKARTTQVLAERDGLRNSASEAEAAAERARDECEALRTAQASAADELQSARAERDRLQAELEARGGEHDKLLVELDGRKARIGALSEELEKARQARDEATEQLDALNAAKQRIADELDELRNASPPEPAMLPLSSDPDLAPALERFADLLENCATKLEGKATAH